MKIWSILLLTRNKTELKETFEMNIVTTTFDRKTVKSVTAIFVEAQRAQYHNNDIRLMGLSDVGV